MRDCRKSLSGSRCGGAIEVEEDAVLLGAAAAAAPFFELLPFGVRVQRRLFFFGVPGGVDGPASPPAACWSPAPAASGPVDEQCSAASVVDDSCVRRRPDDDRELEPAAAPALLPLAVLSAVRSLKRAICAGRERV